MKWLLKISSYPSFQNLIGQIEAQRYNDNCTENLLSSHMVIVLFATTPLVTNHIINFLKKVSPEKEIVSLMNLNIHK